MILRLLSLPVRGPFDAAIWVARQIHEHAEAELNDPAMIRRALDVLERDLEAGVIDEETFDQQEDVLLARLAAARAKGARA